MLGKFRRKDGAEKIAGEQHRASLVSRMARFPLTESRVLAPPAGLQDLIGTEGLKRFQC